MTQSKTANTTGWKTTFHTLQAFKRWAIVVTLATTVVGFFIAVQAAQNKKEALLGDVLERLSVRTASRAELASLWSDNMLNIGSNIVNSDLMRLYATEVTAMNSGESTRELSESLQAQRPYMDYMVNEFVKQHNLVSARMTDANGKTILANEDVQPLPTETEAAVVNVLSTGGDRIMPVRAMGAELVVDVIRPIFELTEVTSENKTAGALVLTHNVSMAISRLLEPQPLDNKGENFAIAQETANGHSLISPVGLAPIATLPETGKATESLLRSDETTVFAATQPVPNTPFIAVGEFTANELATMFKDAKRAIYGSALVLILVVMVIALWILWLLIGQYSRQRNRLQDQTLHTLVRAIEIRDPYLAGHHQRLAKTTLAVAQMMEMDAQSRTTLFYAAQLCGIGMIFIPQEVLTKPGKLTPKERKQLEEHVTHADDVLKGVDFDLPIRDVITQMHERVDGSGYPKKLKGAKINTLARILSVCDVYCALTSPRIYRQGMTSQQALKTIDENIKTFDPHVVAALKRAIQKGKLPETKQKKIA